MTTGLRETLDADLEEALERVLAPRLTALLEARADGHCARVSMLETPLAVRLCRRVRDAVHDKAQVHVLGQAPAVPGDVAVASTKLIELRNPDGERQRPPLLVFVPPGSRVSAEDSFDVATFEEVALGDVYRDLAARLAAELPADLARAAAEVFAALDEQPWPHADPLRRARYLLTIQLNDNDPAIAGAALFELGLVPDFELLADPAQVYSRTARNLQQMRVLTRADRTDRQRVIDLGLTEAAFRSRLAEFLVRAGIEDPLAWTRRIVVDRENWSLAFHRWPLRETQSAESLRITVAAPDLPVAGERDEHAAHPTLAAITGQPFMPTGRRGLAQLALTFSVEPDPRQVTGVSKFTVQLVAQDSGPTGVGAAVRVSRTAKNTYRAALKKLRTAHLDPGWHFIRVTPVDDEGIALPSPGESDRFFVVPDDEVDEPPVQQRAEKATGLTQALRRLQFKALEEGRAWSEASCHSAAWKSAPGSGRHLLHLGFGSFGTFEIPLSPVLTDLQQRTLAAPDELGGWHLPVRPDTVGTAIRHAVTARGFAPDELADFLAARRAAFEAIRGPHGMTVEGTDLTGVREQAQTYAQTYASLLTRLLARAESAAEDQVAHVLGELSALLRVDCVEIAYTGASGRHSEVILVAPTHPLRLLWMAGWAQLGLEWLHNATDIDASLVAAAGRSLAAMTPLGFPLVVPRSGGRLAIASGDLAEYWGACLPTETADPQSLLADLAAALHLQEGTAARGVLSGKRLADRIERYLRLHPYVTALVINAVNPGRAEHLADMLIDLQQRKGLAAIAYDIRLFAAVPATEGTGDALAQLLRGEWSPLAAAEAFHIRQAAATTPKLSVALRPLSEFRAAGSAHSAHITMLFDAFSGERFDAADALAHSMVAVHGLRQDLSATFVEDGDLIAWYKRPHHGPAHPLATAEDLSDLLSALPATISAAAAAVTTGRAGTGMVPRITLTLDTRDGELLHQAHASSDWVMTIDRTLGAEYFDNPTSARHPDYVIDVDADTPQGLGHHIVVSSRSADELQALITPAIQQHGLDIDPRHTRTFFDQLRLLSGRLAFKLASVAANERTEVLGLALARLYLDYQHVLADQILLPLDAHLELYADERRRARENGQQAGLQRTDLALFSLDASRRLITCRLVEVKCYSTLGGLSAYEQLKDKIAEQLDRSATVLSAHFDPHHTQPDRPDRAARNADFAALLRTYLDRAVRYATMRPAAAHEARWLLDRLDEGYRLEFTRTGLIFDLADAGASTESENGIEYHRVGRNLIEQLLAAIPTEPDLHAARTPTPEISESLARLTLDTLPRLPAAAFRSAERTHAVPSADAHAGGAQPTAAPETPETGAGSSGGPVGADPARQTAAAGDSAKGQPAPHTAVPRTGQDIPAQASVSPAATPAAAASPPPAEIYLGTPGASPQYGILGQVAGQHVALDLNETHTISLFGVQGGGKSYTLGTIIEAATLPDTGVNHLPHPLATIVFHYSPTLDYAPEFTSMTAPNTEPDQIAALREQYKTAPASLTDLVMLVPSDQLAQRRSENPGIQVLPLKFASNELRAEHWRFLMGAIGNQSTYIRQIQRIIKAHRSDLRLDVIRAAVDASPLTEALKHLAQQRLDLADEYIDDHAHLGSLVQPGRVIIVDLRDEFIEKDEALGLFVVLMQLFAEAGRDGNRFNKLVVFDEAHKYIDSPDLVSGLVESVREMRHKGMSVLVASQDPPSVPISLIELSSQIILHKFTSPAWLKHLQRANASLAELTPAKMASLAPGEAYVWSSRATDPAFTKRAVKVKMRPRVTRHGGATKTAIEDSRNHDAEDNTA